VELLGAVVNEGVLARLEDAAARAGAAGTVAVASRAVQHPAFPRATVRTPLVVRAEADGEEITEECFGPVAFLVTAPDADACLEVFRRVVRARGALTAGVYSTGEAYLAAARQAAHEVGVALSENLTGGVYVNQTAAFSDFHATGANAAANATYTDGDFVAGRFRVIETRRHLPAEAPAG
jgi:acyl-CoA reductase-like NAD-dependent aldehyde dehydrogenase